MNTHIDQLQDAVKLVEAELHFMHSLLKAAGWRNDGYLAFEDVGEVGLVVYVPVTAPKYQNRCYTHPTIVFGRDLRWQYTSSEQFAEGFAERTLREFLTRDKK